MEPGELVVVAEPDAFLQELQSLPFASGFEASQPPLPFELGFEASQPPPPPLPPPPPPPPQLPPVTRPSVTSSQQATESMGSAVAWETGIPGVRIIRGCVRKDFCNGLAQEIKEQTDEWLREQEKQGVVTTTYVPGKPFNIQNGSSSNPCPRRRRSVPISPLGSAMRVMRLQEAGELEGRKMLDNGVSGLDRARLCMMGRWHTDWAPFDSTKLAGPKPATAFLSLEKGNEVPTLLAHPHLRPHLRPDPH